MKIIFYLLLVLLPLSLLSQNKDSTAYTLYKDRIVLYSDLGFNSAPFSLKDNYNFGVDKIKYKNNTRAVLGLGVAYKWFAFRLGLALPGQIRPISDYGKTDYFDLGVKFSVKKVFIDIDLRNYRGYVVKDEYKWNDSLTKLNPNGIYPTIHSVSASINAWYFNSKDLNMRAVFGKVGHYEKEVHTWYLKSSVNYFGITNGVNPIVPVLLSDSSNRQNADAIAAFDFGVIPGYAYVNRMNNWQFAVFGGIGGVIQTKFYSKHGQTRGFLGIAPRFDFRLVGGYTKPKYFLLLSTDFDNKSFKTQELKYNQLYYNIRLIAGIRIVKKEKKELD